MARPFKSGDKVIISGPRRELQIYDKDPVFNRKGTIVGEYQVGQAVLAHWAQKIPHITPNTKIYFVDIDDGVIYWIFDLHMSLDLDALPYDEWVRARDWNKIYQDQSKKLMAGRDE
jgi:hypothetical protein